jgi:hypothetical protein
MAKVSYSKKFKRGVLYYTTIVDARQSKPLDPLPPAEAVAWLMLSSLLDFNGGIPVSYAYTLPRRVGSIRRRMHLVTAVVVIHKTPIATYKSLLAVGSRDGVDGLASYTRVFVDKGLHGERAARAVSEAVRVLREASHMFLLIAQTHPRYVHTWPHRIPRPWSRESPAMPGWARVRAAVDDMNEYGDYSQAGGLRDGWITISMASENAVTVISAGSVPLIARQLLEEMSLEEVAKSAESSG